MKLTDSQIKTIYAETANYTEPDSFASDLSTSSMLLDPDTPEQEIDLDLFEQLCILWHVANAPFKDLLSMMGLNQTQCSTQFCIPLRTVQDWAGERRTPPPYVRLMMAELAGIVRLRDG